MEPYVDWFHFMSYDIHGTWDGNSPYTKSVVQPHTNLTGVYCPSHTVEYFDGDPRDFRDQGRARSTLAQ